MASAGVLGLFLLVQIGALALVDPFEQAGYQSVEDPQNPTNSILYIVFLLIATGGMLLVFRYDVEWLLRGVLVLTSALIAWYVFSILIGPLGPALGVPSIALSSLGAAILGFALLVYPEWYVIDAVGVVMGAGAGALFGISFGVLPALVLLSVLAIYDAISVYGTEHMLTLASGVLDLKVPVILVMPLTLSYSFLDDEGPETATPDEDGNGDEGESEASAKEGPAEADEEAPAEGDAFERDALYIGLGDAVIPTVLVASAAFFIDAGRIDGGMLALNLPAVLAAVGTLCGLATLLWMVMKGRAHAGLPLLNGGAIGGYLAGALLSGLTLIEALGLGPYF